MALPKDGWKASNRAWGQQAPETLLTAPGWGLGVGALALPPIKSSTTPALLKCPVWSWSPGEGEGILPPADPKVSVAAPRVLFQPCKAELQQNQTELNPGPRPRSTI